MAVVAFKLIDEDCVEELRAHLKVNVKYVSVVNSDGCSLLEYAIKHDKLKCTNVLISEFKMNLNVTTSNGSSLITCVKSFLMLRLLLEKKIDPNGRDCFGSNVLINMVLMQNGFQWCKLMLTSGAKLCCFDGKGNSPLHLACSKGNYALCELFINFGIDVNARNGDGETALLYYVSNTSVKHNINLITLLVMSKTDLYLKSSGGMTVFGCKRLMENYNFIRLLEKMKIEFPSLDLALKN